MSKVKTVIVDDEKKAREGLQTLVAEDSDILLVKTCKNGVEAVEFLKKHSCDLLLLDIQMPAVTGFEVLKSLDRPPFTIFITAYDQYALKAFEHHALDYLLKPFTNDRFFEALNRAKKLIKGQNSVSNKRLNQLLDYIHKDNDEESLIHSGNENPERLVIRSNGKIILLQSQQIERIEADDYYIKIHLGNVQYMIRESLKKIHERLPASFLRIHKSTLVNTNFIKHLEHLQNAEYMLSLESGVTVKVSRTYKNDLDRFLENL